MKESSNVYMVWINLFTVKLGIMSYMHELLYIEKSITSAVASP